MAKSKPAPAFERDLGVVRPQESFFEISARSLGMAERLLPWLVRLIMGMLVVSILAMVVSLASVYRHPNPQVLLTFPDGATRCAPLSLDMRSGHVKARSAHDAKVCHRLGSDGFNNESGNATP